MKKNIVILTSFLIVTVMALSACAPAAPAATQAPQTIIQTQIVTQQVQATVVVQQTVVVQPTPAPDQLAQAKAFLKGKKICAVLSGPVNDAGWNTEAYNGLVDLRDNFGMTFLYHESTQVQDAEGVMSSYADAKCDIIIAHGFEYADQVDKVAADNPNIQFMETNRCTNKDPNVMGICYAPGEGGYFVGFMAAQISKKNKIAWIIGQKNPTDDWDSVQAEQACKDLGGKAITDEKEVGDWNDPAKAKELTTALIEQNYDVFVLESDASDAGIVQAISDARKAGKSVWAISYVSDKNYLAPDFIIGGWSQLIWKMMENSAMEYGKAGKPVSEKLVQALAQGAYKLNPTYGLIPADVEQKLIDLYQNYLKDPKSIPNLVTRTDL
jgi:basic membrane protein A and related proteins